MATEGRPWAVCAVRARAGALCFAPDGEQITKIHAINAQHPQTPRCVRELRELGACAVAQPRRRERGSLGSGASAASAPATTPSCVSTPRRRWWSKPRRSSLWRRANNGGRDRRDRERAVAHNYSRGARRAPRQRANSATSTSEVTLWRHARERRCTTRRWWRCLRRRAWHAHLR